MNGRLVAWASLAVAYLVFALVSQPTPSPGDFDLLDARGRLVESAISEGRFADALPSALSIRAAHPGDLVVLQWLAEIYRGLGDREHEIAAWRELAKVSHWSDAVCPALPLALAKSGDAAGTLEAYAACADHDQSSAQRQVDLGEEQVRQGFFGAARNAFERARRADPADRSIARRIARLAEAGR